MVPPGLSIRMIRPLTLVDFADLFEQIEGRLVAGDQAFDPHAGDVVALLAELANRRRRP